MHLGRKYTASWSQPGLKLEEPLSQHGLQTKEEPGQIPPTVEPLLDFIYEKPQLVSVTFGETLSFRRSLLSFSSVSLSLPPSSLPGAFPSPPRSSFPRVFLNLVT